MIVPRSRIKLDISWPLPFLAFLYSSERKHASLAAETPLAKRTKYIKGHRSPSQSIYPKKTLQCQIQYDYLMTIPRPGRDILVLSSIAKIREIFFDHDNFETKCYYRFNFLRQSWISANEIIKD